ncbi:hypothetical protein SpCBS45565_g06565 [Spizellomyces sp. 'palustris']|nr:hypothetical protein SpCBS45565_g06565 [Spizellomyces sp. 'palustris']
MQTIVDSSPIPPIREVPRRPLTTARKSVGLVATARNVPNVLHNWSGINPIARTSQIRYPKTEQQLSNLIRRSKGKIGIVGSALSFEKIATVPLSDDTSVLVNLKHFTGLRRMTESTAVFGAQTTVDDVIRILGEHDRMMPCSPGVIGIQTLAGSMATGTHGQGLFQSAYSDIVVCLRVVLPHGEIAVIGGEHSRSDLPLQAFVTSLGMLGVITEVEIRTEPRRVFACKKVTCDFDDFIEDYTKWNQQVEYVKVWWFPETDQVHVWFTDPACPKSVAYSDFLSSSRDHPIESAVCSAALNDTVSIYCTAMSHDTKSSDSPSSTSVAPQFKTVRRFADARDLIGYSEQILCKGIPVPQINCEIAVPMENFTSATLALREWSMRNKGRLHYPFIYRATGRSEAWLSPAFQGPVVYIGLLVYIASDGTVRDDGFETMREVQKILAQFGGLPHWGKHFVPELYDFERRYTMWTRFEQIRQKTDPENKFLNPFLGTVFGRRRSTSASAHL